MRDFANMGFDFERERQISAIFSISGVLLSVEAYHPSKDKKVSQKRSIAFDGVGKRRIPGKQNRGNIEGRRNPLLASKLSINYIIDVDISKKMAINTIC